MNVLDDIATNPRLAAMLQDMQDNVYQPNTYMSQPMANTQVMTGASDMGGYKAPLSTVLGNTINPYDAMSVPVDVPQAQQAPINLTLGNKIDPYADMRVPVDIPPITEEAQAQIAALTQQPTVQQPMQPTSQPKAQPKAQQQAMPTQPEIKQAIEEKKREISLLELFARGFTDAFKEPISETGKTSNIYDMLRGAMAVQAPQQSAIMEQEIKGLQDTEAARVKAEAELEKQTLDLQGKILLEQAKKGSARDANYYFSKSNSQVLYTTPTPEQLADPRLKSRIIETSDGQKVIQVKQINANDPNVQKLHLWNNMMKIQDGAVDMMNKFGLTPDMILTKSPLITQIAKTPEFKAWHNSLGRAFQEYRTAKTGAQASDKEIERLKPLMPTGEEKERDTFLANLIQIQKEASVSNEAILDGFQALGYDVNGLSTMLYQPRTLAQSQEQSTDWNAEKEARYQELLKKQGGGK